MFFNYASVGGTRDRGREGGERERRKERHCKRVRDDRRTGACEEDRRMAAKGKVGGEDRNAVAIEFGFFFFTWGRNQNPISP